MIVKHGAARRPDPDRHDLRPGPRPAARRRHPHRVHVLPARPRPVHDPGDPEPGLPGDHGRGHAGGLLHRDRQHGRRHPVRRGRPEGEAVTCDRQCGARCVTGPSGVPASRSGDLRVALPDRRRPGQGGRRGLVQPGARQDAGHRRRVGLGQERDQPGHHGPAPRQQRADQRPDLARRRGAGRRRPGPGARAARQQDGDDLPGSAVGAAPLLHGGRADRRGLPGPQQGQQEGGPAARRSSCWTGSASRSPRPGSTTTRTSSPAACGSGR